MITKLILKAKGMFHKALLNEHAGDPVKFWESLKKVYPSKNKDEIILNNFEIDGEYTSNKSVIVSAFGKYFSSITNLLLKTYNPIINYVWKSKAPFKRRTEKQFLLRQISATDVDTIISALKTNKSAGYDNLHPSLLKDSKDEIKVPLSHIFNLVIKTGLVPNEWKIAKVLPILKSGNKLKFDNYRPISVLPIISKVFEEIVH
ncbi:uncharacterized protein LOC136075996 [Hydra vulgaris]|uniref:Uncharacterized protein LOC136075996 n=1 Tax=Hydra vulgaris TaxID=6087 RepID=A0ABM4B9F2_HYDVU